MIVVTGAAGLLGNTLTRLILAGGRRATAIVRGGGDSRPLAGLDLRVVEADLAEADPAPFLAGVDVVIHCAARVAIGHTGLAAMRRDNVGPTARLAAACRTAGIRLVHVSTVDTLVFGTAMAPGDGTPAPPHALDTAYALSKREAEAEVAREMAAGLDAVIVHPGFLLGAWDWKPSSGRLLLEAARAPVGFAPPGGNDVCHAGAVAVAILTAADRAPPGSRWVLSGEALGYARMFAAMRRIAGRPARIVPVPAGLVRAAGAIGDIAAALTGREPALNSASAALACVPHHFSSAAAVRELDYRPRPAEEAIGEAWTWFRAQGYA